MDGTYSIRETRIGTSSNRLETAKTELHNADDVLNREVQNAVAGGQELTQLLQAARHFFQHHGSRSLSVVWQHGICWRFAESSRGQTKRTGLFADGVEPMDCGAEDTR